MDELEDLRAIFQDDRLHVGIGTITQLGLAKDGSKLRVQVKLLPESYEIVAMMTFSDAYDVTFPEIGDLVLLNFVDGHPDEAHVVKVLNTKEEPLPTLAKSGHSVREARPGKKLYLHSDTKVGIGKPNVDQTSALVLGDVLVNCLTDLLNDVLNASQIGQCAVGPVYLDPSIRTNWTNRISKYLTTASTNILSQVAFTERGS